MVVQRPQLSHPATPVLTVATHDLKCLDFLLTYGKKFSSKACPLVHQEFTHLWCQGSLGSPVLFSCSLGKSWSVSHVHPGRLGSTPSQSMSLGVGWQIQGGRSDTPVCLVVCPQTCSHIHQCWKHWKPSVSYTCRGQMTHHLTSTHNTDDT